MSKKKSTSRRRYLRSPPTGLRHTVPLREVIRHALQEAYDRHGSIRQAAKALEIPKSTFADRAHCLGVKINKP